MRIVFTDSELNATCCRERGMAQAWGDRWRAVALALCTLRAANDLAEFLALPNVIQENGAVTFKVQGTYVQVTLDEVDLDDRRPTVAVTGLSLRDAKRH